LRRLLRLRHERGGSTVTVDRTAALSWETFTISITHN